MNERIQELILNYKELHQYLLSHGQVSYASTVSNYYKKILVFSCASLFENEICNAIYNVSKKICPAPFAEFIRNKAVERQYHTYFNWKLLNASAINNFLGLWGEKFKVQFLTILQEDEKLSNGAKAFIEIGQERNLMAHENFIEYHSSKSFEDIELSYTLADYFVQKLIESIESIHSDE